MADDGIQHGIDDNPSGDAEKGATLGGVGGAVTGAIAGAAAGPVGAVLGAVIGGVAGAVASGAAVAAVDRIDNDDTITGVGGGATTDVNVADPLVDNGVPGVQTGGYANDGTPDTRGIGEKVADSVTGDTLDDKTGRIVDHSDTGVGTAPAGATGVNQMPGLGETTPSLKTGGVANDGTPDTRGIGEKVVDAVTGDTLDDKTGKVVNHP